MLDYRFKRFYDTMIASYQIVNNYLNKLLIVNKHPINRTLLVTKQILISLPIQSKLIPCTIVWEIKCFLTTRQWVWKAAAYKIANETKLKILTIQNFSKTYTRHWNWNLSLITMPSVMRLLLAKARVTRFIFTIANK